MPGPAVVSNFFEDVRKDSQATLAREGIVLPPGTDVQTALIEVFHFKQRVLPPMPRKVAWSKELSARSLTDDQRAAVKRIVHELEQGVDTRPRMTKAIRRPGYNDGLLTDWGIHHMHIGEEVGSDGFFIERDGPLLFVFVVRDTAYLLDLLDHGSFEDERLIEILHGNWPGMMATWLAPGFVPGSLEPLLTPEQRKVVRRKFNMGTQTKDGTIYLPPGGGIMMSGHSVTAVEQADRILNLVHPAEVWVREHADWLATQVEAATGTHPSELHLMFATWHTMAVGTAVLFEARTGVVISEVPPLPGAEPCILAPPPA